MPYIRHVKNFTIFLGRSPDQARPEDLNLLKRAQRREVKMSLKKGVFIILICAAYAYVVFWYGFAIYGAIGER